MVIAILAVGAAFYFWRQCHQYRDQFFLAGQPLPAGVYSFQCDLQGNPTEKISIPGFSLNDVGWVHADDREACSKQWQALLKEESGSVSCDCRVEVEGKIRYYELNATRLVLPSGKKIISGWLRDVSAQRFSDQELANQKQIFMTILDEYPNMLFIKDVDDDFRYVFSNRVHTQTSRNFLPGLDQVVGKLDSDIYPENEARMFRERDEMVLTAPNHSYDEIERGVIEGGLSHSCRTIKKMLTLPDGRRMLMGICIDTTQQEATEQELAKTSRLLQNIMDNLPCMLFVKDPENGFKYVMANQVFADFCGCSPEELVGKDDSMLFPRDYDVCLEVDVQTDKLMLGNTLTCREFVMAPDGKEYALQCIYNITEHENRRLLLGICVDITQQEATERELARSESEKLLIMDSLKIPIMMFGTEHQLVQVNNAGRQLLAAYGDASEDMVELSLNEERYLLPKSVVAGAEEEQVEEIQYQGRDYMLSSYPIRIQDELTYWLKTMVDVTDYNEVRRKLIAAVSAAESANKAKSFFLATVSHELRTPLNVVIGFSELLKQGGMSPAEQVDCIESINLAGSALLNLINDVLDLSKIEADQMEITRRPTDVMAILDEIMSIFRYKAKEKGLEFLMHCSPAQLPVMEIDSLRLRQILLNIVGNALKFTARGQVKLSVEFIPEPENSSKADFIIKVSDTGCGISEENRKMVFEPFFQQRTHASSQGTGLGLTITSRLIAKMDGSIELESEVGKGSTFTIRLHGISYSDRQIETDSKGIPVVVRKNAADLLQTLDILIVDDVPVNLKVLEAMLKKLDLKCRSANSAAEALEEIDKKVPHLVLTDMWMPNMNGYELARRIREKPGCEAVKIAAVTADSESQVTFDMTMFDELFLKPLTLQKLKRIFNLLGVIE